MFGLLRRSLLQSNSNRRACKCNIVRAFQSRTRHLMILKQHESLWRHLVTRSFKRPDVNERDLVPRSIVADCAGGVHSTSRRAAAARSHDVDRARMNYSKFNAVWQPGAGSRYPGSVVGRAANPVVRVDLGATQRLRRLTHTFDFLIPPVA